MCLLGVDGDDCEGVGQPKHLALGETVRSDHWAMSVDLKSQIEVNDSHQ